MIDPKLFKKYDIRGRAEGVDAPLTESVAQAVGRAFASHLKTEQLDVSVVVGHDNRRTSPALANAFAAGVMAAGVDVRWLGLCATPTIYWYAVQGGDAGGAMITGSHLAPEQNGFKLSIGARNLFGDDLQALRGRIERGEFTNGAGARHEVNSPLIAYIEDLAARLPTMRPLRVIVDAGNGTGGLIAPRLFERLGHQVKCLYCEPDGSYPNHQPDPSVPENMRALGAKVRADGADIGIAFDGDADRMGVVDEYGEMIVADRVLALLARDMLSRNPGASVVADVLCSQVLFDEVARHGGKPVMWASGHSLVKAKMAEIGALLGGEQSGHLFLAENYYGVDDAFLVAGRFLSLLSADGGTLSALNATLPTLHSTPEYRPRCPDEAKSRVIEGVAAALAGAGEAVTVDGVRVRFPRGWGLLRASNTEPVLSLRFEGETETDALYYRDLFAAALRQFPEVEPIA